MTESILIEALGLPVELDLDGLTPAEAQAVRRAWRDAETATGALDAVRVQVREQGDASDLAPLLERLSQRVTLAAIEAHRGRRWMLHAAGLALPDGRVVVLVGPSGRGKTTASLHVARRFGYVSDETIAMDAEGRVFAYRKPLSIIEGSDLPKAQRAPSDLGLVALPSEPLRLAAIVLLDRQPEASDTPVVQPVDLGDALGELVAQTSFLAELDRPLEAIARLVERAGGVQRVVYREAETLGEVLAGLAAASAEGGGGWRPEWAAGTPTGPDGIARVEVVDAIALDDPDRLAVLRRDETGAGHVSLIAGIAPTLWRAASGVSRDVLVQAAIDAHGRPEGASADDLVDAALAELFEAGLLRAEVGAEAGAAPDGWRIGADVAWHDSGDRVVVLPLTPTDAPTRVLEGSAAFIWRALAEGAAPTEVVVARVADLVGVDDMAIHDDVAEFLTSLIGERLLTRG